MRLTVFRPIVLVAMLLLAGCASGPPMDPRDPNEAFNREVNGVNRDLDHAVLRPAARAYHDAVPSPVRTGVSNFFGNLGDLWSATNSLLQLKVANAAQDTMRFAVNSVFGLGGLIDIASDASIERHKEDFGTTLAHWGVPPGPYVVLPLLGPSTLRDTAALPLDWIGDPAHYVTPLADREALLAGHAVDARSNALPLDTALDSALDEYTFLRDAYLQHRTAQTDGPHDEQAADPAPVPRFDEPADGDVTTASH